MRPSKKEIYISMVVSVILGAVIYIAANALGITIWAHIISIFISLVIIEFMRNVCFPIDPKSKCLEKVDITSAVILFILVFGPIATIFNFITSILGMRKKRRASKE